MNIFWIIFLAVVLAGCTTSSGPELTMNEKANVAMEQVKPLDGTFSEETQYEIAFDLVKADIAKGNYVKAAETLKRMRKYNATDIRVYRIITELYERQNNLSMAYISSQEGLKLDSATRQDEELFARLALLNEDYQEAEKVYQVWFSNGDSSQLKVVALNNLGFSALLQKKFDMAKMYLTQALAVDPLNEKARNNLKLIERIEQ